MLQVVVVIAATTWFGRCAVYWQPGFDEWWHVWFGEVDPWRLFLREISYDTHPPTLSLLLRLLSAPGDSPLWARSAALLPAIITLPLFYRLSHSVGLARPVAHLATATLAFSHTFVSLAVSVRSYALSLMFLTLGLTALAHLADEPTTQVRRRLSLAVLGILGAGATLYVALLPGLLALAIVMLLPPTAQALAWRGRSTGHGLGAPWAALVLGLGGLAAIYIKSCHVPVHTFIGEHVRAASESVAAFVRAGFNHNLALFTPFAPATDSNVAVLIAIGAWSVVFVRAMHAKQRSRILVLLLLPAMALVLATAGAMGAYPWGGNSRHQVVLFLPLLLSAMFVVDDIYRRLSQQAPATSSPAAAHWQSGAPRNGWLPCHQPRTAGYWLAVVGLTAAVTSYHSYGGPPLDDYRHEPIATTDYGVLTCRLGAGDTVIVPRYAQIGLYARTRQAGAWRWLGTHQCEAAHFDRFAVRLIDSREVTVLLDHTTWCLPDEPDAAWGQRVAHLLTAANLTSAWLFAQTPHPLPPGSSATDSLGERTRRAMQSAYVPVAEVIELTNGALLHIARP